MSETENKAYALAGHAIQLEQIFDADGALVGERLHHYTTCRKCVEGSAGRLSGEAQRMAHSARSGGLDRGVLDLLVQMAEKIEELERQINQ